MANNQKISKLYDEIILAYQTATEQLCRALDSMEKKVNKDVTPEDFTATYRIMATPAEPIKKLGLTPYLSSLHPQLLNREATIRNEIRRLEREVPPPPP